MSPRGAAPDGKVEDYQASIAPPRESAGVFGPGRLLSDPTAHGGTIACHDGDSGGTVFELKLKAAAR